MVNTITLPNKQTFTFHYDPIYELLSEIDYPDGGWVKYTWKQSDTYSSSITFDGLYQGLRSKNTCNVIYKTPVVATRQVGFTTSKSPVLSQAFTYSTQWNPQYPLVWTSKTTTVDTTDNATRQTSRAVYTYGAVPATPYSNSALPVETNVKYYDWGNTSTPARVVDKTWGDPYELVSEKTTLQSGQSYETVSCYQDGLLAERDEFDFGSSLPSFNMPVSGDLSAGTCSKLKPSRRTSIGYQPFPSRPGPPLSPNNQSYTGPDLANSYSASGKILDLPCQTTVSDNQGLKISETDVYYDGASALCTLSSAAPAAPVSVISGTHDETLYGPNQTTARGNATQIDRLLASGKVTNAMTYDTTGQLITTTDGCGNASCSDMAGGNHTTTFSYADSFDGGAGSPSGATNAYLTKVTTPSTNGVTHARSYSYRFSDGQISTATDENSQATTYSYNDPLFRLKSVAGAPDTNNSGVGPTTQYNYDDTVGSPSVSTWQNLTPNGNAKTTTTVRDGMGHVVQTQLTSNKPSSIVVDTTYTGTGAVHTVSNPYFYPQLTNLFTTTNYDALGRKVSQSKPDGSFLQWCYDGVASAGQPNCSRNASTRVTASWIDSTDEIGHHRQTVTDGLSRLAATIEPSPSTGFLGLETEYTYDMLDNLIGVAQKGTSAEIARTRTFTYDALSRLLCAANPETGADHVRVAPPARCRPMLRRTATMQTEMFRARRTREEQRLRTHMTH